jgi:hypothetical protein
VRWQRRLDLDDFEIRHERVSTFAVCDMLCRVGNSLVGIRADHERREAVVFHTRRLRTADVVHELLHLRHPEWSERGVNSATAPLLGGSRSNGRSTRKEVKRGDPGVRRQVAKQGQRPLSAVRKVKYERVAKNCKTVVNHALRATHNETNLTKFGSRDDWERIDAPEE